MKPNFSKALPKIVSTAEWQIARDRLLAKEKAHTRAGDALAAERRRLPMVEISKAYQFDGANGKATLLDCSKRAANSSCTTLCSLRTFAVGLRPAAMLVPGTPTTLAT